MRAVSESVTATGTSTLPQTDQQQKVGNRGHNYVKATGKEVFNKIANFFKKSVSETYTSKRASIREIVTNLKSTNAKRASTVASRMRSFSQRLSKKEETSQTAKPAVKKDRELAAETTGIKEFDKIVAKHVKKNSEWHADLMQITECAVDTLQKGGNDFKIIGDDAHYLTFYKTTKTGEKKLVILRETDKKLGTGATGVVKEWQKIHSSGKLAVKSSIVDRHNATLNYEKEVLLDLHKDGAIEGLQRAPVHTSEINGKVHIASHQYVNSGRGASQGGMGAKMNTQGPRVLRALQTFHKKGYTHGDIKPENFFVDKRGNVDLADFGGVRKYTDQTIPPNPEYPNNECILSKQDALGDHSERYVLDSDLKATNDPDTRRDLDKLQVVAERRDAFAMGLSLYEMATGTDVNDLFLKVNDLGEETWNSQDFKDFHAAKVEQTKYESSTNRAHVQTINDSKFEYIMKNVHTSTAKAKVEAWLIDSKNLAAMKDEMVAKGVDSKLAHVIVSMMNGNPETRMTVDQAVKELGPAEISVDQMRRASMSHTLQPNGMKV